MIYLLSFKLSEEEVNDPYIYPYSVFRGKDIDPFVFSDITILYGDNGSGKSTVLNIIADRLNIKGNERPISNMLGRVDYCEKFTDECSYDLAYDEKTGRVFKRIPAESRYIKSEDILYEVKKIEQQRVLADGMLYDQVKSGKTREEAEAFLASKQGRKQQKFIEFSQEKYSNGETALRIFDDMIIPDALYLLDEPEISLSPANQVKMAEEINKMSRLLGCQFIIATHSPFLLGTLNAKIYNIDTFDYRISKWYELENVRYFYDFFKNHDVFEQRHPCGIHHISMKCGTEEELERVKEFYISILGYKIAREWPDGMMIDTGNGLIEIYTNAEGENRLGAIRHVALITDSVDGIIEKVRAAGYEVIVEPNDRVIPSDPEYPIRMAFCFGPLGEQVEFFCER